MFYRGKKAVRRGGDGLVSDPMSLSDSGSPALWKNIAVLKMRIKSAPGHLLVVNQACPSGI